MALLLNIFDVVFKEIRGKTIHHTAFSVQLTFWRRIFFLNFSTPVYKCE